LMMNLSLDFVHKSAPCTGTLLKVLDFESCPKNCLATDLVIGNTN
jgi:hypothetical protein